MIHFIGSFGSYKRGLGEIICEHYKHKGGIYKAIG